MNTRSKRASSVGILLPFILAPVLADGTVDVGDRQHIAYSYSGIAPAASAQGAGSSAGVATVTGVGASTAAAAGTSAGAATVSGVGASTLAGVGSSAGSAAVSGVGETYSSSGAGSSAGAATVSGVGASIASGVGTSAGSATASGIMLDASTVQRPAEYFIVPAQDRWFVV